MFFNVVFTDENTWEQKYEAGVGVRERERAGGEGWDSENGAIGITKLKLWKCRNLRVVEPRVSIKSILNLKFILIFTSGA